MTSRLPCEPANAGQVSSIREAFETEEEDDKRTSPLPLGGMASCSTSSSKGSPRDHSTWIFQSPYTFGNTVIDPMLPMPSQMFFTWQAYVENIDPFLKIVHVPTITEALRSSKCRLAVMDPAMCALLSCISFAAIASLTEEEVAFPSNGSIRDMLMVSGRSASTTTWIRQPCLCVSVPVPSRLSPAQTL